MGFFFQFNSTNIGYKVYLIKAFEMHVGCNEIFFYIFLMLLMTKNGNATVFGMKQHCDKKIQLCTKI